MEILKNSKLRLKGGGTKAQSVPTIMRSRVRIPCTPSMLFPFIVVSYVSHCNETRTNINKRGRFGPYLKNYLKTVVLGRLDSGVVFTLDYNEHRYSAPWAVRSILGDDHFFLLELILCFLLLLSSPKKGLE